MARKAPLRHLDLTLLLVTLMLSVFGALMIYSATVHQQTTAGIDPFLRNQLIYMVVGFVVLLGVALFDYRYLRTFAAFIYGGIIFGLLIVLTPIGSTQLGATRSETSAASRCNPPN